MSKFKHSKLRNTGLLFEFLLRQVTVDVLNKKKESPALKIIKTKFNERTELGKELALYNLIMTKKFKSDKKADFFLSEVIRQRGKLNNMKSVTNEVNIMMGKSSESDVNDDINFGASDVMDLSWLQLLNAYSCTECGRCTSVCPANMTGKKLSPRKIMMDTRDRIEEVGKNIDVNGKYINDNKKLLGDYISEEELWACTSCNACIEECPISINPLSIIMDMRRNLVMEDSSAPSELNNMMSNIENNGAPWPYNQQDRLNWNE